MSEKVFLLKIKEHQNIIYKLVHLYAVNEENKKDLYQEILLQAWKSYPSFKGVSKFSTWLYRLSLNTIFTVRRKVDRIEFTDTNKLDNHLASTTNSDEKERLYKAIRTLPETERAIISLHLDGYDNKEIAEIMGISGNLVGVKLHRGKQQLNNLLKNI